MDLFMAIFTGTIIAATPLVLAALGELVVEKSGVLNLGIEGMMLIGAALGVRRGARRVAAAAGDPGRALAGGAASSMLFGVLALTFLTNQYAAGLALAIFGSGLSAMIGNGFGNTPIAALAPLRIPDPVRHSAGRPAALPLRRPRLFRAAHGRADRAGSSTAPRPGWCCARIGESPQSAHAIGYPVIRIRYLAVLFGGAMAGLAGAYLSVVYTPLWVENMTAGRGWIALALVVFSTWRPYRVLLGAWLFGGMTIIQLQGQVLGLPVPSECLSALPYVATIVVLVLISRNRQLLALNFPESLAKPFRPAG